MIHDDELVVEKISIRKQHIIFEITTSLKIKPNE